MNKPFTIPQIRALKPTFQFGGMTMIDWFKVDHGKGWATIRNGLVHADGETKSPYHIEIGVGGSKASLQARKQFTDWWNNIKKVTK